MEKKSLLVITSLLLCSSIVIATCDCGWVYESFDAPYPIASDSNSVSTLPVVDANYLIAVYGSPTPTGSLYVNLTPALDSSTSSSSSGGSSASATVSVKPGADGFFTFEHVCVSPFFVDSFLNEDACFSRSGEGEASGCNGKIWRYNRCDGYPGCGGDCSPGIKSTTGSAKLKIDWSLKGDADEGTLAAGTVSVNGVGTASVSIGGSGDPTNNSSVVFDGSKSLTENTTWSPSGISFQIAEAPAVTLTWDISPTAFDDSFESTDTDQAIATWGKDLDPFTSTGNLASYSGSWQARVSDVTASGSNDAESAYSSIDASVSDFTWD